MGVLASGLETTSNEPDVFAITRSIDKKKVKVLTTYPTRVIEAGTNKTECPSHGFRVGMKAMISSPGQRFNQFPTVRITIPGRCHGQRLSSGLCSHRSRGGQSQNWCGLRIRSMGLLIR